MTTYQQFTLMKKRLETPHLDVDEELQSAMNNYSNYQDADFHGEKIGKFVKCYNKYLNVYGDCDENRGQPYLLEVNE